MAKPEVLVIGAGVVGAAVTFHLASRGIAVVLIDRDGLAGGTSSACQSGVGFGLSQRGFDLSWSLQAMAAHAAYGAESEVDYVQTDALLVPDPGDEPILKARVREAIAAGLPCDWLDHAELADIEPNLNPAITGAGYLRGTGEISPMRLVNSLVERARQLGATVRLGESVRGFERRGDAICRVMTTRGEIRAGCIVVASGVWSREIAALAGEEVPVWPLKGNVLVTEPVPRLIRHYISEARYDLTVESAGSTPVGPDGPPLTDPAVAAVLQPLPSGSILMGSSRQFAGFDRSVDRRAIGAIAERVRALVPILRTVRVIRSYAGLRPWTPDGRPLVGPSARLRNLWFATGHGGEGNTGSLLTGHLLADLYTGVSPVIDPSPVSPARLAADQSSGVTP